MTPPVTVPTVPADRIPWYQQPGRRVIVLGAGMSGLVAADELLRSGHQPVILEARGRVGGRIHTVRDFAPGLYAEAGAMRIPLVHQLTLGYCRRFGLQLRPFVTKNPQALVHLAGERMTARQAALDPARLPFTRHHQETGRTHEELWEEATEEIRDHFLREGERAIEVLAAKYDGYSIRGFLKARGWSEGAIEQYGIMNFTESTLGTGVLQEFLELIGAAYDDVQEIIGGMDRLPNALYEQLKEHIWLGTEVQALEQDGVSVRVHARRGTERIEVEGDFAVCTIPFSVLRGIDTGRAGFSRGKLKAIRQLHYDAAAKIYFQVRRPFWEQTDGIRGGTTVTDLSVRRIVYPSHPASTRDRTMLLASYTWGQDALQWSALEPDQRVERALRDVAAIHPEIVAEFEAGFSYSWYRDPYAMGAYALFEPDQRSALRTDVVRPEGRIHFAGEHCSDWPAWIEGAVASGLEAARAVHAEIQRMEPPVESGR